MGNHNGEMRLTLDGDGLGRLREVRRFVRGVAAQAGLTDQRAFDFTVVVSEAAANAVKEGDGRPVELTANVDPTTVSVTVSHPGGFAIRPHAARSPGLGLPLMAALADDLTVSGSDDSTTVTVRFSRA